ncbi:conserved hypothetical protein [Neospora caninum Liverpool]|uniref:Uncharacterized protein n=1 Tax=Neospora caninum (strain Liverpool) TaxID=572307 RepID=F0VEF7_NEOCL|nr:conserved hypothetical protein [Neospora caninum Liverpool]CBZ52101.1 conserved hypothetical protein [Neospora caninum Liverpool]|eukprot:XP_003882133.1 conserved hypothetical protein [Neospora caninum Liverpool]
MWYRASVLYAFPIPASIWLLVFAFALDKDGDNVKGKVVKTPEGTEKRESNNDSVLPRADDDVASAFLDSTNGECETTGPGFAPEADYELILTSREALAEYGVHVSGDSGHVTHLTYRDRVAMPRVPQLLQDRVTEHHDEELTRSGFLQGREEVVLVRSRSLEQPLVCGACFRGYRPGPFKEDVTIQDVEAFAGSIPHTIVLKATLSLQHSSDRVVHDLAENSSFLFFGTVPAPSPSLSVFALGSLKTESRGTVERCDSTGPVFLSFVGWRDIRQLALMYGRAPGGGGIFMLAAVTISKRPISQKASEVISPLPMLGTTYNVESATGHGAWQGIDAGTPSRKDMAYVVRAVWNMMVKVLIAGFPDSVEEFLGHLPPYTLANQEVELHVAGATIGRHMAILVRFLSSRASPDQSFDSCFFLLKVARAELAYPYYPPYVGGDTVRDNRRSCQQGRAAVHKVPQAMTLEILFFVFSQIALRRNRGISF